MLAAGDDERSLNTMTIITSGRRIRVLGRTSQG